MKYLPIQINQEWHLREVNPMPIRSANSRLYDKIEKEAIANARPIINHDGREWYDSKDLQEVEQRCLQCWGNNSHSRQAWKYIGEKPVEKAYNPQDETVRNAAMVEMGVADESDLFGTDSSFVTGAEFGSNHERTRIIGIIEEITVLLESKDYNAGVQYTTGWNDCLTEFRKMLLTKINNNGNENSI